MNIKSFRIVFFLFFGQIFTFSHTLSHHQIIIFLLEYNFSVALNKIYVRCVQSWDSICFIIISCLFS